jgi:hypothetical protein
MGTRIVPRGGVNHGWRLGSALVMALVTAHTEAFARDYYFRAAGNDGVGDGSRRAPWQTIAKLNTLDLEPGDRVLFRAGETFLEPIVLDAHDSATDASGALRGKPIRFLSFGRDEKPVISSPHGHGLYAVDVGGLRIQDIDFAGSSVTEEITDTSNVTNGLLFENTQSQLRQHDIVVDDVVVHGFGEAGIHFRGVNPASASGGFADVWITHCLVHTNGRSGVMTSVRSDTGTVVDGSQFDFQSRAHANFTVSENVVHDTTGKNESNRVSGNGIVLPQMANALIAFNVAHHNGGVAGGGGVAIWTWESDQVRIQFNEAYASKASDGRDGEGFDLDGGARQGIIQYNYSHGNLGAGYGLFEFGYASAMQGNVIRYNISENDGGGLGVWGNGPRFDGTDTVDVAAASLAYGNTVVYPQGPGADCFGSVASVGVYNTIFLASGGPPLVQLTDFDGAGPLYTLDVDMLYNAYWSGVDPFLIAWDGTHYSSVADWAAATQQEIAGELLVGVQHDPGLHGPFTGGRTLDDPFLFHSLGEYRLLSTSLLIDAGGTVSDLPLPMVLGLTEVCARDFYRRHFPQGPRLILVPRKSSSRRTLSRGNRRLTVAWRPQTLLSEV